MLLLLRISIIKYLGKLQWSPFDLLYVPILYCLRHSKILDEILKLQIFHTYQHLVLHQNLLGTFAFSALKLLVGQQEEQPACKKLSGGIKDVPMVGCWQGCVWVKVQVFMSQQIPLPLTISCSSKSRFVLPSRCQLTGLFRTKSKRAIKRLCVCVCVCVTAQTWWSTHGWSFSSNRGFDRLALLVHRGAVYRSTGVCGNLKKKYKFTFVKQVDMIRQLFMLVATVSLFPVSMARSLGRSQSAVSSLLSCCSKQTEKSKVVNIPLISTHLISTSQHAT